MGDGERIALGHVKTKDRSNEITAIPELLKMLALNPLKAEKSLKIGVAARRKRAGWDLEYLRSVLGTQMK